jgi:hypothetical protein
MCVPSGLTLALPVRASANIAAPVSADSRDHQFGLPLELTIPTSDLYTSYTGSKPDPMCVLTGETLVRGFRLSLFILFAFCTICAAEISSTSWKHRNVTYLVTTNNPPNNGGFSIVGLAYDE